MISAERLANGERGVIINTASIAAEDERMGSRPPSVGGALGAGAGSAGDRSLVGASGLPRSMMCAACAGAATASAAAAIIGR